VRFQPSYPPHRFAVARDYRTSLVYSGLFCEADSGEQRSLAVAERLRCLVYWRWYDQSSACTRSLWTVILTKEAVGNIALHQRSCLVVACLDWLKSKYVEEVAGDGQGDASDSGIVGMRLFDYMDEQCLMRLSWTTATEGASATTRKLISMCSSYGSPGNEPPSSDAPDPW